MNYISDTLYWISTGLLVPVIVLLILLFVRALLLIGSFFGQYLSMRKCNAWLTSQMKELSPDTIDSFEKSLAQKNNTLSFVYARKLLDARHYDFHIQKVLSEFEISADKDLEASAMLMKLGPILGLMGTLIPMGPALVGLSTGDIASMAYNMQVAFATTVVGLFSSAIGFVTHQVKQRWYLQDMTNLEFLAGLLLNTKNISNEKKTSGN